MLKFNKFFIFFTLLSGVSHAPKISGQYDDKIDYIHIFGDKSLSKTLMEFPSRKEPDCISNRDLKNGQNMNIESKRTSTIMNLMYSSNLLCRFRYIHANGISRAI